MPVMVEIQGDTPEFFQMIIIVVGSGFIRMSNILQYEWIWDIFYHSSFWICVFHDLTMVAWIFKLEMRSFIKLWLTGIIAYSFRKCLSLLNEHIVTSSMLKYYIRRTLSRKELLLETIRRTPYTILCILLQCECKCIYTLKQTLSICKNILIPHIKSYTVIIHHHILGQGRQL